MTTKITSIRLEKDLLKDIEDRCKENECNRNDWIKNAIENQIDLEINSDDAESEEKPIPKVTFDDTNHDDKKPYYDENGNRFYWDYARDTWVCEVDPKNFRIVDN